MHSAHASYLLCQKKWMVEEEGQRSVAEDLDKIPHRDAVDDGAAAASGGRKVEPELTWCIVSAVDVVLCCSLGRLLCWRVQKRWDGRSQVA